MQLSDTVHTSIASPFTKCIRILQYCCHWDAATQLHTELQQIIKILAAVHDGSSVVLQNCYTHKEVEVLMVRVGPESLPKSQHLQYKCCVLKLCVTLHLLSVRNAVQPKSQFLNVLTGDFVLEMQSRRLL